MKTIKGIPIKVISSPNEDVFSLMNKEILGRFGLPINNGYEDILLDFVNYDEIVPGLIESTIRLLEQKGKEYKKDLQHLEHSGFLIHQNETKQIVSKEVRDYLNLHLDFVLSEKEFLDIETGFRLRWNYSTDQIVGDGDFKRSVDSYLTSIESPMNRKKMGKVVDRILEYLEIIGQWG